MLYPLKIQKMTIYVLIRIQETYEVKLETKIPEKPKEAGNSTTATAYSLALIQTMLDLIQKVGRLASSRDSFN